MDDNYFNHVEGLSTCDMCGKENCEVTMVDECTYVCDQCLAISYFKCADCGEYWNDSFVEPVWLKNGDSICQYCAEDHDPDDFEEEQ